MCYRSLIHRTDCNDPWNSIWKRMMPPKIKLFLWKLSHQYLPTSMFLSKRGIAGDLHCKRCTKDFEDIKLIFWHCPMAIQSWKILTDWLEYYPTRPSSFNLDWLCNRFNVLELEVDTLWSIWLARNDLVFNNVRTSSSSIEFLIKYRSFCWRYCQ